MFDVLDALPNIILTEKELYGPVSSINSAETLRRLGVINKSGLPKETEINILANAFASHFIDALIDDDENDNNYEDVSLAVYKLISAMEEMQKDSQFIGLYYFITGVSSQFLCSPPRELWHIASRRDTLELYINRFIKSLNDIIEIIDIGE